jgi:hypothetical protein
MVMMRFNPRYKVAFCNNSTNEVVLEERFSYERRYPILKARQESDDERAWKLATFISKLEDVQEQHYYAGFEPYERNWLERLKTMVTDHGLKINDSLEGELRNLALILQVTEQLTEDYEGCGDCGFDHEYERERANTWHLAHPCSYCKYDPVTQLHEVKCPVKDLK